MKFNEEAMRALGKTIDKKYRNYVQGGQHDEPRGDLKKKN